jgi:hypothetical protein
MRSVPLLLIFACLVVLVAAAPAFAQGWPPYSTGSSDPHFIDRGFPGEDAGGWIASA